VQIVSSSRGFGTKIGQQNCVYEAKDGKGAAPSTIQDLRGTVHARDFIPLEAFSRTAASAAAFALRQD
jgi:hypothetical protein